MKLYDRVVLCVGGVDDNLRRLGRIHGLWRLGRIHGSARTAYIILGKWLNNFLGIEWECMMM